MTHGPVMVDIEGLQLTAEDRELLRHPNVGGIILFARNFESSEQVHALCTEIHSIREPRLLIAVDQEGGRVQRFRDGFSRLPPLSWFGECFEAHQDALHRVEEIGWLMAAELRAVDVDFSFAPVLDVGNPVSEVIGDRAFHQNPDVIARLAQAWMRGVHSAGMPAIGKHFPGHGNVRADSHHELPVDERSFNDLMMEDLRPFERMIHFGMEAIMPAHVVYPRCDDQPAGFSRYWLQAVLREQLGFQGAIFSDDLNMGGASGFGTPLDRALLSLDAGCDMVLVCNNRDSAASVVDGLGEYQSPAGQLRLTRMHGKGQLSRETLHLDPRWQSAVKILSNFEENPAMELDIDPTDYASG